LGVFYGGWGAVSVLSTAYRGFWTSFCDPLRHYSWDARSATPVQVCVIFGHASARIQRNREK